MRPTSMDQNRTRGRRLSLALLLFGGVVPLPLSAAVNVPAGTILTVAGTGVAHHTEDGGPAAQASVTRPVSVVPDARGGLYFSEITFPPDPTGWIRSIGPTGILDTVAGGGGTAPRGGTETPALEASIHSAFGVVGDAEGTLFFAEWFTGQAMRVNPAGVLTVVAGGGSKGPAAAEGGSAIQAALTTPFSTAIDAAGDLYIVDEGNDRVCKVTPDGILHTVAGGGSPPKGTIGDGGPAVGAVLFRPGGIAVDDRGNLYIAEGEAERVRKVDSQGIITTVAGTGKAGFSGDGGPAVEARLYEPQSVVADTAGNLFIVDRYNGRVRKVDASGIITTVAGGAVLPGGNIGDGGPALGASLINPFGIAIDAVGNLYLVDGDPAAGGRTPKASDTNPGNRIRKVFGVAAPGLLAGAPFPAGSPPGPGGVIMGDLDFDVKVDVTDAVISLQIIAGLVAGSEVQHGAGDLNGDGALDVSDTVLLLKKAVGL